jgi:hypothetical protein
MACSLEERAVSPILTIRLQSLERALSELDRGSRGRAVRSADLTTDAAKWDRRMDWAIVVQASSPHLGQARRLHHKHFCGPT